jgi:hypothetical protein
MRWNGLRVTVLALVATGCAHRLDYTPGLSLSGAMPLAPLARAEYQVLSSVHGEACRETFTLVPLPIWWNKGASAARRKAVSGSIVPGAVGAAALYDAIQSVAGADAVIAPRWTLETTKALPWWSRTCVQLDARAIHIKSDAENAGVGVTVTQ